MQRRTFLELAVGGAAMAAVGGAGAFSAGTGPSMTAASFHASRKFVQTRFGNIACVDKGTGPAALFLHGFPLNSFQWRGVLDKLSGLRRCIAPDFMALGYTDVAIGQDVSPDSQVVMLIELLDTLGISMVDLVANDSGGAVAQLLLVRYPKRVRSLLLTNCDTQVECPPAALKPVIEMAHAGTFADQWLGAWLADKELARSAGGLGGQCYLDRLHPTDEAIDYYLRPLVSSQRRKDLVHAYAIALERNVLAGVEYGLQHSTVPTRVVWGDGDTIFSLAGAAYLEKILGQSKGVRRLAGSKLFWPEEQPGIIISEARALWEKTL
jgi:haloalkane dehalogenase